MSDADQEFKNYFNYFTEVEEQFQRARGTGLFLLSPLDWALIESWKNADVPLEAVLRGIQTAFDKWRSKKSRTQMVNSVAYCAQAVAHEAQILSGKIVPSKGDAAPPFSPDEVRDYFRKNAVDLRKADRDELASKLETMAGAIEDYFADLEALEQTLTALEDKLIAEERSRLSDDELIAARRDLDLQLRPYRSRMTAEQLVMLEKQYLDRRLLERAALPRLSLFYLR